MCIDTATSTMADQRGKARTAALEPSKLAHKNRHTNTNDNSIPKHFFDHWVGQFKKKRSKQKITFLDP